MAQAGTVSNEDRRRAQDYMRREFNALVRRPERPIYHYTDGAAAARIVDCARLWATNILFLDDGREMQHTVDYFRRAQAQWHAAARRPELDPLNAMITRYLSGTSGYVPPDVWVVAFTESRNSVSHWAEYQRDSHGVALGFAPHELLRAAEAEGGFLVPCCYDDQTKIGIMLRGLDLLERLYLAKIKAYAPAPEIAEPLVRYIVRELALFGALMKRSELAHENEWRLIVCNRSQTTAGARHVHALAKPGYTSLYLDLPLGDADDRLPLAEVLVGPGEHHQLTARAFRTLLYKNGYEGVEVTTSGE